MVIPKAKSRATSWLALKKSKDAIFREKTSKFRKEVQGHKKKKQREVRQGVICLSNIPHGFCENEMERYFRQYGVVNRTKLVRSKRTGESCGYGYVEFEHDEVAKIVAKTMNGYLTFGKIIKCKYIPGKRVSRNLFKYGNIRPHNCPKMLSRKNAINNLNKFRTETDDKKRIKRLKSAYGRKLKMLNGFGISLNLELPQVQIKGEGNEETKSMEESLNAGTNDSESMDADEEQKGEVAEVMENQAVEKAELAEDKENQAVEKAEVAEVKETQAVKIKGSVSSKPKKLKKINGTDRKVSGEDIAQDGHHSGKVVIEVDESDVEIQFKTPPNAVKKFVKMAPFQVTENTVAVKPISSVAKMDPKKKVATENMPLDEEKNAATGLANPDGNCVLESIMSSNPSVTRNEKTAKRKKKKAVKSISKCKENFSVTPVTVALPNGVECIQDNAPSSTASDVSLPKTTPVKRKQANNQTPAKKLFKKMKAMPSPATLDAQVVSVGKVSSTIRTPISSKAISDGIDTSNIAQVTKDISQSPHVQTSEETLFSIAPKKDMSTKKSRVTKKSVSPLTAGTKTPKKMQKLKKVVTPKTLQSNSLTPELADLENATVFPESEIASSGTNTAEDIEVMENTTDLSHAVSNPTQTLEVVQIPPISKKSKTPKNKTKKMSPKKMGNADYTQTPKKVEKVKNVVTPKTIGSKSMPFKREELKNVTIFPESEMNTSPVTNTAIGGQVMANISQLPLAEENSKQNSDQGQLSASFKKTKSPKNKTPKRGDRSDYNETPIKVKKVKKVVTPKTPDCSGLPPKKADSDNVIVFSGSEIEASGKTDTPRSGEVVTNAPQLPPTVETPIKTSEEMKLPLSTKKNKTPKTKAFKKTPKRGDSVEDTETPKTVQKVLTPKTPACKSLPPKKAKSNNMVFLESEMKTSLGANTPRIAEAATNSSQLSPPVETPIKTAEQVQLSQSSKKNKTPKTKTPKRRDNPDYTETPKKMKQIKKVVTPETPDCNSLPPKKAGVENVIVVSGSETESSLGTNTAKSVEVVTNTPELSPTVEAPVKTSEQKQLALSTKKTKTPKNKTKKTPKRESDCSNYTETPKKVKHGKKVITPKKAESESALVLSGSEIETPKGTNTARSVEVVTETSHFTPAVETSEQVPLSSKKTKTPKNKKKKTVSPKGTGSSVITQTPIKMTNYEEVVITNTPNANKSSSKKSKLGNNKVVQKDKCISSKIKKSFTPAHFKTTPKQKIKPIEPKTA